ncbi:hypothetical protein FS837_010883 [Tulasnella sp. UAMH 9824]|nr:hypothetical protein FS837_010883 [Tulasnella sp. UAMH 9824]
MPVSLHHAESSLHSLQLLAHQILSPKAFVPSRDTSYGTATNGKRVQVFDNLRFSASRTKDNPIWLADDIFTTPKTSRGVTIEPKFEFQPPQEDGKAEDEFPRMMDMEQALDEATIHKGLEQVPSPPAPNTAEAPVPEIPTLRTEYLPYMFAAKAPSHLPLTCANSPHCVSPHSSTPIAPGYFRCTQCFGRPVLCGACLIRSHQHAPFHWPEQWVDQYHTSSSIPDFWHGSRPQNYGYFKRTSLREVGLHVGLGHEGALCPVSHPADAVDLTILHTTGQHVARFRPCACSEKELWQQLLEVDIWPSTHKRPKTGCTIEVLRHQRCFSLRSKTNMKEYYDALVDLTNAAENKASVPYAYDQLRLTGREHRVLVAHMRAGRPDATASLANGELCVGCPTCPDPEVNLPPNWERDRLKQLRYVRFLAGDGNFKLQHLSKRSLSATAQTSLFGDGGFWAPEAIVRRYLSTTTPAPDEPKGQAKSACNTMAGDPGSSADGSKGLDISGIFCVSCRHVFISPNGVIDLHKGEKYRYADVCFAGPLNASYSAGLRYFVITYDIACKYGVNFKSRCCKPDCNFILIPTHNGEINLIFCVNKFHQESHDDDCAAKNALDYTKYVGRTCGEGVETIWASMNWLRYSTREMGFGARIETLSEHFNDWNWQKTLGIARHLTDAYAKAVESLDLVMQDLDELEENIGSESASKLRSKYEDAGGEQFLQDTTQLEWVSRKDLFARMQDLNTTSTTLSAASATDGNNLAHINIICKALVLETTQAKLCQRAHDLATLSNPPATLKDRVKTLMNTVKAGLKEHHERLFEVLPQLENLARTPVSPANDEILLPSRLSPEDVLHYNLTVFMTTEAQLRVCHAYDLIHELRKALGLQSFWTRHVEAQHSSQTAPTRGQTSLRASIARVREIAYAYKFPGRADEFATEEAEDDEAEDGDGCDLDGEMDTPQPEPKSNPLEEIIEKWRNEFIRLEFVHTLAAVERWTEEVDILTREMPATCRSLRHFALVWAQRANEVAATATNGTPKVDWANADPATRGYVAYASRKFDLYAKLTTDALKSFVDVVGSSAWEKIWSAPHEEDLTPIPKPSE